MGQCSTGQSHSIRRLTQVGQQPARLIFQVGVLLPELEGAFPQAGVQVGIALLQQGQDLMSDKVSGVADVLVGGVLYIGDMVSGQVGVNFPPLGGEQWPDDVPPHWRDAAQSAEAAASNQMEQQRFTVVLGVVGSGDAVGR